MPSCDHLYACDYRWWKHHIEHITRDYEGTCWTQNIQWEVDPAQWGIKVLQSEAKPGLSKTPGVIHQGQNSGYQAIGLALELLRPHLPGRVILLGFDMQTDGDRRHWFGAHPQPMDAASSYPCFIRNFQTIDPKAYGIEIWNVTRKTALQHFPLHNLDEVCAALS